MLGSTVSLVSHPGLHATSNHSMLSFFKEKVNISMLSGITKACEHGLTAGTPCFAPQPQEQGHEKRTKGMMWQASYGLLLVTNSASSPATCQKGVQKTSLLSAQQAAPKGEQCLLLRQAALLEIFAFLTRNCWTYFRNHIHQTNLLFGHHRPDCLNTCAIQVFFVFSMFHKSKK